MMPGICRQGERQQPTTSIVFRNGGPVLHRGWGLPMKTEPTSNTHCRRRHFRVDVPAPELALCQNIRSRFFVQ